jgi:hypothetical protein
VDAGIYIRWRRKGSGRDEWVKMPTALSVLLRGESYPRREVLRLAPLAQDSDPNRIVGFGRRQKRSPRVPRSTLPRALFAEGAKGCGTRKFQRARVATAFCPTTRERKRPGRGLRVSQLAVDRVLHDAGQLDTEGQARVCEAHSIGKNLYC